MTEKQIIEKVKELNEVGLLKGYDVVTSEYADNVVLQVMKDNKYGQVIIHCADVQNKEQLVEIISNQMQQKMYNFIEWNCVMDGFRKEIANIKSWFEKVNDMQLLADIKTRYDFLIKDVRKYTTYFDSVFEDAHSLKYSYVGAKCRVLANYLKDYYSFSEETRLDISIAASVGRDISYSLSINYEEETYNVTFNEDEELQDIKNKVYETIFM